MPSTHSAVISFYGAYIYLASTYLPIHRSLPDSPSIRTLSPLGGLAVASIIAMSRIWLGHHTWPQVAAGCAYGIFSAIVAYLFWIDGLNVYGEMLEIWADSIFGWR
jgi:dolichyldiphosphatase